MRCIIVVEEFNNTTPKDTSWACSTAPRTETVTETPSVAVENISGDYTLDPSHTRIGFSARHAMVTKVRGHFDEFEGSAHVDTVNPANSRSP